MTTLFRQIAALRIESISFIHNGALFLLKDSTVGKQINPNQESFWRQYLTLTDTSG